MNRLSAKILLIVLCSVATGAAAQHPVDVQRYMARGEYFEALTTFEQLPQRRITTDTRIAAAKSAWALGLMDRAAQELDAALKDDSLPRDERARQTVSRGIIEFQEGRYQDSILYAEKALSLVSGPSPLRARALCLWGQALFKTKAYGAAEEKLTEALKISPESDEAEMRFIRGQIRFRLAKYQDAQADFETIPLDHDRAPLAIRYLARLALEQGNFEGAGFWLTKGRQEFPDYFVDSWVEYARMRIAAQTGDRATMSKLLEQAQKQYPPSDPWIVLAAATAEIGVWQSTESKAVGAVASKVMDEESLPVFDKPATVNDKAPSNNSGTSGE